ncbi:MAG: hypothetical protein HRT57_07960 [Crocinitomicaceae bacterium]|nr:hypothetical protein [Crocinitomicaceae bacterium]
MKQFRYLVPPLILLGLLTASCSKADNISSTSKVEGKIRGEWIVDKVALEDNGKLFETDITGQYEKMKFNFDANNELSIVNQQKNETYPGVWYLDEIWTWDEEDQEEKKTYSLYMSVYNPSDTTQISIMTWTDLRVSSGRLVGKDSRLVDDGMHKYTYRLKR